MNKMARLSRELVKVIILQHKATLRKSGATPVSEVFEALDSVRGVLTPLTEARKRELFGVTFKAISDIERIARGLGFETDENAGLLGERRGLFSSRSAGFVERTVRLPEDPKPIRLKCSLRG